MAVPRAEKLPSMLNFFPRTLTPLGETARLPHLKLVAKANKCDLGCETGVRAKTFRKADAAVPIEAENLDVAVERDRQLISLI